MSNREEGDLHWISKAAKGFKFFWKGIKAAKNEMFVSAEALIALTVILAFIIQAFEHHAQPEVYSHWYDSLLWSFMRYLGNPGKFSPADPVTLVGRLLWILISIIQIAIFAVPAGLVAKGFAQANAEDKRKQELKDFTERLRKSFRTKWNRVLEKELEGMPDEERPFTKFQYVPDFIPVMDMQVSQSMDIKDIMDAVNGSKDFRLRNQADAGVEGHTEDRLLVEHAFINTSYGCCIDRGSKVTIVSPKSREKIGIGWFSFQMAKMGGFNFISKELEVDKDEPDNYYEFDGNTKAEQRKKRFGEFQKDLKSLTSNHEGAWVICMMRYRKLQIDKTDLHLISLGKNGKSTVTDETTYEKLQDKIATTLEQKFQITTDSNYERYLLKDSNIQFLLDKMLDKNVNSFTMRLSSHLISFNERQMVIMFAFAKCLADSLTAGIHFYKEDREDIKKRRFGYNKKLYKHVDKD